MSFVVVLNGPSCAGKTTLARALRDRLGPTCTAVSVDQFYAFTHRDARPRWALYKTLSDAMFTAAATLANGGLDVIVDTVFERPELHETAKRLLAAHTDKYVAVTCPLPIRLECSPSLRTRRRTRSSSTRVGSQISSCTSTSRHTSTARPS